MGREEEALMKQKKKRTVAYKDLTPNDQRHRMEDALYSGGSELREFIEKLAKRYAVPLVPFTFWLLAQESSVDFNVGDFDVVERKYEDEDEDEDD